MVRMEYMLLCRAMAESVRRVPLHTKILIGLVAGAIVGGTLNSFLGAKDANLAFVTEHITNPIGQLLLRLLLLLVVPLVFSSLVVGVAGLGDLRRIGRIGVKSLIYTLIVSAISVVIGLTLANTIKPGKRIDPAVSAASQEQYGKDATERVESAVSSAKSTDTPLLKVGEDDRPDERLLLGRPRDAGHARADVLRALPRHLPDDGPALTAAPLISVLEAVFAAVHGGHPDRDAARAVRGVLPAVHDDGAVRVRPAGQPRMVRRSRCCSAWRCTCSASIRCRCGCCRASIRSSSSAASRR